MLAPTIHPEVINVKTLMIMRHAKSSWSKPVPDDQRPLNKRGKAAATKMGEVIRERGLLPDLIITSIAKRARSTAKRLIASSGYKGKVVQSATLYFEGVPQHLKTIMQLDDALERVMIVGHNPDLESLLMELTGREERMPTAALAVIDFEVGTWKEIINQRGQLRLLLRPRELME